MSAPVKNKRVAEILLRREKKVLLPEPSGSASLEERYPASVMMNLETFGYCMSAELFEATKRLGLEQLIELNDMLIAVLSKSLGAHRQFHPMYPNFPADVMKKSQVELYLNAILHYLTAGKYFPLERVEAREPLSENPNLKIIGLGKFEDARESFQNLMGANVSLSQQDRDDLVDFTGAFGTESTGLLPELIPNRENKACVLAALSAHGLLDEALGGKYCTTAIDVLRLAVALSGGDISLAKSSKFKTFNRTDRRLMLGLIDRQANAIEDMLRWKGRFIRLAEKLHPFEYGSRYPRAREAFDILRNDLPFSTLNSKLEIALERKNLTAVLELVKPRPGIFARRLDHLLRIGVTALADQNESIGLAFSEVADSVSTPVLLQLRHHFKIRGMEMPRRVFFPKGELSKAQSIENKLVDLPETTCKMIESICSKALEKRFASLPPLGACYIDERLSDFMVPFALRSASKALRTVARGSRLPLPGAETLRFFIWWKNGSGRTDIDLSAALFDENFYFVDALTYYNLKNFAGHHSGDIIDAPEGASEFIDISVSRMREHNVRFLVMVVNSYSRQPFKDLPECFAGWMSRSKPKSGEVYEPRTVEDKFDLTGDTRISLPAIFDLEKRETIWTDLALTRNPAWFNNLDGNLSGIQISLRSMVEMSKPNLYDLFALHARARGRIVDSREDAETVFSASETAFQLDMIASKFMSD